MRNRSIDDGRVRVPRPALVLGAAGYLPFLALSLHAAFATAPQGELSHEMLLGYGAVILSFLGGIHWGRAIAQDTPNWPVLTFGVIPSLIGWLGLAVPFNPGAMLLVSGFVFALAYDLLATRNRDMPEWYPRLRIPLTLAVCAALLLPVAV
ncbi:DUF3429 domain-containing protein [Roseibium sp.]|uniref:DUF3429 domain-containing protein n=1 Tax=Roseibium sp. TaxID=1936156 RepID=UPI003A98014E